MTMLEGMQKHYSGDQDAEQPFQSARDKLFVTKSLCLLSSHPIMKPLQAYLEQLYAVTAGGKAAQLPVESYLFNLLYRVPMPRPGHKIVISGPLSSISWRRPSLAELPICDYSFTEFFELLGLKNIVKLLTCLLLEHQVLLKSAGKVSVVTAMECCALWSVVHQWGHVFVFSSADYQRLMLCAFCAVSLLFPFNWHHVFVPILPAAQVGFLDAPVPFLMGLHVDPLVSSRTNLLQLEVLTTPTLTPPSVTSHCATSTVVIMMCLSPLSPPLPLSPSLPPSLPHSFSLSLPPSLSLPLSPSLSSLSPTLSSLSLPLLSPSLPLLSPSPLSLPLLSPSLPLLSPSLSSLPPSLLSLPPSPLSLPLLSPSLSSLPLLSLSSLSSLSLSC